MLEEIEVHRIPLISNVIRKYGETDKAFLQRIITDAIKNLPKVEDTLNANSDHLVRQHRFEISRLIKDKLLAEFYKIVTTTSSETAKSIIQSGRLETGRVLNVDEKVFFYWTIPIPNPFDYPICICDDKHFG